jgi:hypothetical protein
MGPLIIGKTKDQHAKREKARMKQRKTKRFLATFDGILAGLVIFGVLALAGCDNPAADSGGLSSDAALGSLSVSAGFLSPAFSADVAAYTVTVANGVESITVSARAADDKATVSNGAASGFPLSVGSDNTIPVKVTAENGGEKIYAIVVVRLAAGAKTISTAADLAKIGADNEWPLAGAYVLDANLVLDDWTPLGSAVWTGVSVPLADASMPFSGSLDGGGHTIALNSFSDDVSDNHYIGIFSALKGTESAKVAIKNLNIVSSVNVSVTNTNGTAVGLLAGYSEQVEFSDIALSGAFNTRSARVAYVGGIAGYAQKGTLIQDSFTSMNIDHSAGTGGGFVASSFYNFVGGFAGIFKDGADITNCHNSGNVRVIGNKDTSQAFAGGIAGGSYYAFTTESQGSISYCSNTGNVYSEVKGFWAWTGGIAGCICGDGDGAFEKTTRIYRCWASGDIASVAKTGQWPYTGGITGYIYYGAMVAECYFTGTVEARADAAGGRINDYAGGISGYLSKQPGHEGAIRDCWSGGTVKGYVNAGGIVGQQQVNTYLWNCWSKAIITVSAPKDATGSASQQGAGGIAGFNGSQETGGAKRPGKALSSCVALNPSVAAPNGFERLGRVIGENFQGANELIGEGIINAAQENNHGWSGMAVTVGHAAPESPYEKRVDGTDCPEKPEQSFYQSLGWDFGNIWKMDGDGYPAFQWQ